MIEEPRRMPDSTVHMVCAEGQSHQNFDGVYLAQREIENFAAEFLDDVEMVPWQALLEPEKWLTQIGSRDIVYCNVDPYAFLLFLAREELSLSFRIGRNVQTGPWTGYLHQELLCGTLTRACD